MQTTTMIPIIGKLTLPALLGGNAQIGYPELLVIAQRLLQEATAWDSSADVTALMLQVKASQFSVETGTSGLFSSVEVAHLTTLLHELKETVSLELGLQLEPNNVSTPIALWQLGLVKWVVLASFHQGVLHPQFGFLSPYPLETLFQAWKIPDSTTHWLVVDAQYWNTEAVLHHWQYLQNHPWVKAICITMQQAEMLHQKGLWLAENSLPCWVLDAPTHWLESNADWLLPKHPLVSTMGIIMHQSVLRPLQSAEVWPYSTDTTDPKRIEAYLKQLHHLVEQQLPKEVIAISLATEGVEEKKQSKCPFGFGRK
jgi:hypothetical protein